MLFQLSYVVSDWLLSRYFGHVVFITRYFRVYIFDITILNAIKWSECVDVIVRKSSKRLYMLRVLCRSGIPIADFLVIYNASIRSTLEYACVVWHDSLPKYVHV